MKAEAASSKMETTTQLGDWFATNAMVHRRQLVLAVSTKTLFPVLLPAAPFATVVRRVPDAVAVVLLAVGAEETVISSELAEMRACAVAKTNDRRVVGTLVDFTRMLDVARPREGLVHLSLWLARTPCSVLGMSTPVVATRKLLASP